MLFLALWGLLRPRCLALVQAGLLPRLLGAPVSVPGAVAGAASAGGGGAGFPRSRAGPQRKPAEGGWVRGRRG